MAKRKRIRFHRRVSLVIALALSLIIAYLIARESGVLPNRLSKYINEHYLRGTPFRFSCSEISGDLFNHVVLKGVALRYRTADENFSIFKANRIELDYSLFEVLRLNLVVDNLALKDVRVQILRDSSGKLLVPWFYNKREFAPEGISPHIDLKRYTFQGLDIAFVDSSSTIQVGRINCEGSMGVNGKSGEIVVENAQAFIPNTKTTLHSLRMRIGFSPDSISIGDFVARLDRSYLMLSGKLVGNRIKHLQFVFNPVSLKEISSMGLIPQNEGEVGGSLILSGPPDSLKMRGSVTGEAFGLVFSALTFQGAYSRGKLVLSDLNGSVFGSSIKGRFIYKRGDKGGYSFEGSCRTLDLSEGFVKGAEIPHTSLSGQIYMDYSRSLDRYAFKASLDTSTVENFMMQHATLDAQWTGKKGLRFDHITFENSGFFARGSGIIDANSNVDMVFDVEGNDLTYLWDYFSLPDLKGTYILNGRVYGPLDTLRVNMNGDAYNAGLFFGSIDTCWIHSEIRNIPSENAIARIDVKGKRIHLGNRSFSSPHLLLEARAEKLNIKDFSFSKGDTIITCDLSVSKKGMGNKIVCKHLIIKLPYEIWTSKGEMTAYMENGSISLDSAFIASRLGEFRISGSYEAKRRRFNVITSGREVNFSLMQRSFNLPIRMTGKCRFKASASGEGDKARLDLAFDLQNGELGNLKIENFSLQGAYEDSSYYVHRMVLSEHEDSLIAKGWWKLPHSPLKLGGGVFREPKLGSNKWHFNIRGVNFPVGRILQAFGKAHHKFGRFTGDISLGGSPLQPLIQVYGQLSAEVDSRWKFPDLKMRMAFQDSLLKINSISFDDGKIRGQVEGNLPLVVSLRDGLKLEEKQPARLKAGIQSSDLSSIEEHFDIIDKARGKLNANVELRGYLSNPQFSGAVEFSDVGLMLSGFDEEFHNVRGRLALMDNLIQLATLSGEEENKGSFYGSGFAELSGFRLKRYRADVFLKDFLLLSIRDVVSRQEGRITLQSLGEKNAMLTPLITGSLEVKQATITKSFAESGGEKSPLFMPMDNPGWFCNIEIDVPKNLVVKNPGLNMELGGDIILKRDRSGIFLRGELNVLRGSYKLYNNKFKITDGVFDFSTATSFRPEINLNAYNIYRQGEEEKRIFLNLSWPSDKKEPQLRLSSDDPQYSETDIWKMLGGGVVSGGRTESGGLWDAAGTARDLASNYFEGLLNAQMKDLTIDVESRPLHRRGSSNRQETEMTIAIGKYLSKDIYLKYRQGLSIATEREVDLEYRLGRMLILRTEIIRHSGKSLLGKSSQASEEINFDIKLRFEF